MHAPHHLLPLALGPAGRVALAVALAALVTAFAAVPARAQQTTCPATFEVLHDDQIGTFDVAEGPYTIAVSNSAQLSCTAASDLFRQFLEDFDGKLPRGWRLDASTSTFRRSGVSFTISPAATATGGGGGGRFPASGTTCPGTFAVQHDDQMGALVLPEGPYTITLLATGALTCKNASARFTSFLQDVDGVLPTPWTLDATTGTFQRSLHVGFRVKAAPAS